MDIKVIINNIECNTSKDYKYPIRLVSGALYKSSQPDRLIYPFDGLFYIYGDQPVGALCASEIITYYTNKFNDETGEDEELSWEKTEWITLLSIDEVIKLFIKEINDTEVLIKDSEFLLRYPIVTTGIAKVRLDNCIAHLEGSESGFVNINNSGEFIVTNNNISPSPWNKYGSRHSKEYWPRRTRYHLEVTEKDIAFNSVIGKRGYPPACGPDNEGKTVTMIIRSGEIKPPIGKPRDLNESE